MSTVIETYIKCDKCEAPFGAENRRHNITAQRELARAAGWMYNSGKDICPDCRNPRKSKPKPEPKPIVPSLPRTEFQKQMAAARRKERRER